jgi:hypothetical protein
MIFVIDGRLSERYPDLRIDLWPRFPLPRKAREITAKPVRRFPHESPSPALSRNCWPALRSRRARTPARVEPRHLRVKGVVERSALRHTSL